MKWIISACALFLAWSGQCQGGFTFSDHAWVGQLLPVISGESALTNGAVAHWRLDEASNLSRTDSISGLVLVDSLSDTPSATGLITNAAGPFSTSGQLTNADNATISLGTNTDFTLLAWVKMPTPLSGGYGTVIEKGNDATAAGNEYWINWYGGGTNFVFTVGTTDLFQQIVGDAPVSAGQWHHLAGRYSSAAQKIYWNMDATNEISTNWTGGTFDSSDALYIGNSLSTSQPWTNLIDEVTIFKRFLSSNEVYRVYTNEKAGISYPWTGLGGGGGGGAWSPTNEASLIVWQEADSGVTNTSDALASDGDLVKGWRDQGTLHKDSTNLLGTGGIFKTGIQNGLPAIRFEQTNLFRCDGLAALVQGNDMPLVFAIVYRNENSGSAAGILWEAIDPGGSTKQNSFNLNSAGVRQYVRYDGSTQKVDQGGTANTSWETLILISTGTTATIYTNGVLCGTADQDVDVNSLTATQFSLGHNDAGTYFKGEVGGWMMFTNSAVAMTNIQTYLKGKWATP